MEVKNLTVKYRRTINLGNYESAMLEAGMTVEMDVADDPAEAQLTLWRMARNSLRAQALPILAARRRARAEELQANIGRLPKDLRDKASEFLSDSAQDILDAEVAQAQDVDGVYYAPDDILLERAKAYARGVLVAFPASEVFSAQAIYSIIEGMEMDGYQVPFTDLVHKLLTEELDRRIAADAKELENGDQGAD